MSQFVTSGKTLSRGKRFAIDRDDSSVPFAHYVCLATGERFIQNDRLAVIRDCFDFELARLRDAKFVEQLVRRLCAGLLIVFRKLHFV